jgi:ankyrin repeat protein
VSLQLVVEMLLSAGANPNIKDNLGGCALMEAVKAGQDEIIKMLVAAGAQLCLSPGDLAGQLCSLVYDDNTTLLKRYIAAGADVNVGDYDQRTALHIAAAEGKLDMVRTALNVTTLLGCSNYLLAAVPQRRTAGHGEGVDVAAKAVHVDPREKAEDMHCSLMPPTLTG